MQVILGSQSIRRKEILQFFSIPFVIIPSKFDESKISYKGDIKDYITKISKKKAESLAKKYPNDVIITADTVVMLDGNILLKPNDRKESRNMLLSLSGKTHEVISGVSVCKGKDIFSDMDKAFVTFHSLKKNQIEKYLKSTHGMDKAGSYGIQEIGSLLIKRIEGSFYTVVGLPVNTLNTLLQKVGIDLWDALSS